MSVDGSVICDWDPTDDDYDDYCGEEMFIDLLGSDRKFTKSNSF